jgi:hypothetical protein
MGEGGGGRGVVTICVKTSNIRYEKGLYENCYFLDMNVCVYIYRERERERERAGYNAANYASRL